MIELLVAERCTACNICVQVCPTNVFDAVPGDKPAIARQGGLPDLLHVRAVLPCGRALCRA
ncbi:MAG: 4Fe-4S binding protein [Acetobacteraceae bacterium]